MKVSFQKYCNRRRNYNRTVKMEYDLRLMIVKQTWYMAMTSCKLHIKPDDENLQKELKDYTAKYEKMLKKAHNIPNVQFKLNYYRKVRI